MKSDIEIAQSAQCLPISQIAEKLGIGSESIEQYGKYKAKLPLSISEEIKNKPDGKLVLVTAISPTPAGEGKTTITIGLGEALCKIGKNAIIALREPSMGPVFGIKGGAAGGGYAQVLPMEDINLHFTGDMHAITAANNLLCAIIDNHLQQGNELEIDQRRILFKRCLDMNDRALRNIIIGLGGKVNGMPCEDGFMITVASEIMAILCLASDIDDLKNRLSNILVAYNTHNEPVYASQLNAVGAMAAILKDAIKPNLVQTLENTPALMHGGPFANIAHGCNSVIATKMGLKLADYCVTEAGFGADLGAEKFMDIKCRMAELKPSCVVLVATVRALKYNGGAELKTISEENLSALKTGSANLVTHIENIKKYGVPVVVAINHFASDTENELDLLRKICTQAGVKASVCDVMTKGGEGGKELATLLCDTIDSNESNYKPIYSIDSSIKEKIRVIATEIYRAGGVLFTPAADKAIEAIEALGKDKLPVCIAKTQYSLSDDPTLLGSPKGFMLTVRDVRVSSGAGFIVVYTGNIMTMPGLPKSPAAYKIDVDSNGNISGLF